MTHDHGVTIRARYPAGGISRQRRSGADISGQAGCDSVSFVIVHRDVLQGARRLVERVATWLRGGWGAGGGGGEGRGGSACPRAGQADVQGWDRTAGAGGAGLGGRRGRARAGLDGARRGPAGAGRPRRGMGADSRQGPVRDTECGLIFTIGPRGAARLPRSAANSSVRYAIERWNSRIGTGRGAAGVVAVAAASRTWRVKAVRLDEEPAAEGERDRAVDPAGVGRQGQGGGDHRVGVPDDLAGHRGRRRDHREHRHAGARRSRC